MTDDRVQEALDGLLDYIAEESPEGWERGVALKHHDILCAYTRTAHSDEAYERVCEARSYWQRHAEAAEARADNPCCIHHDPQNDECEVLRINAQHVEELRAAEARLAKQDAVVEAARLANRSTRLDGSPLFPRLDAALAALDTSEVGA